MRKAIILAAFFSTSVSSQQSQDSTGDYAMDLGQVYGAVRAVGYMKDICNEAFPELAPANSEAQREWRAKYLTLLQELEKHWESFAWQEAKGNPTDHMKFISNMEDTFDQYKIGLDTELRSDGPEIFRAICENYPKYLTTERTNLDFPHYR